MGYAMATELQVWQPASSKLERIGKVDERVSESMCVEFDIGPNSEHTLFCMFVIFVK